MCQGAALSHISSPIQQLLARHVPLRLSNLDITFCHLAGQNSSVPSWFIPSHLQPNSIHEAHPSRFRLLLHLPCLDVITHLGSARTGQEGLGASTPLIQLTEQTPGGRRVGGKLFSSKTWGNGASGNFDSNVTMCQPIISSTST